MNSFIFYAKVRLIFTFRAKIRKKLTVSYRIKEEGCKQGIEKTDGSEEMGTRYLLQKNTLVILPSNNCNT